MMKKIIVFMALVFCCSATAQAGWLDSVKDAAKDEVKKNIQEKTQEVTPEPLKQSEETKSVLPSSAPAVPGLSPDQANANACSQYVHEDYKKSKKALEESKLTWGSSKYLPKKAWVDYLKGRYPNFTKRDFYYKYGKWFGKSCAYVDLTCRPNEPGCDIQMKCLDNYTRKGGNTCPPNLCSFDDKKCIEPFKAPEP
ncbi:MAG: hypothetical protein PHQ63_07035 [Smithellaceae bacterium]|jgi:hypothetical protein|nr:hypothetical protein [Smithellaceae bacterium]